MRTIMGALILAAAGCGDKADDDTSSGGDSAAATDDTAAADDTPPTGQLALTFAIDTDYRDLMQEPASGSFWGSFYDADDVTGVGPNDGAEALGSIYIEQIDLTGAQPTGVLFTSEALTAKKVVVLGFMDSDGNADVDDPDPDEKDPVTVPGDNRFTIVDGEVTEVQVFFGLLRP
jgi:hypothetical protein